LKPLKSAGVFALIVIFVFVLAVNGMSFNAEAISAKSYALIELSSERVIEAGNENQRLPMASTTKIMTALIAVESGKLNETFSVPPEAVIVEGSSMGLKADEKITLRELVCGLMLESGNDAANAIAIILGGSISHFADMMNSRAQTLGLSNTHFCNPSGLDNPDHYTTALDLARLAAYAMKNKDFAQIVGTKKMRISYDGIKNARLLFNHNRLLNSYPGEIGVKTGFTKKSGRCLVSCACRNGVTLVAVTLNDPNDWKDHTALLDSGFSKLKNTPLLSSTPEITAKVVGGKADTVETAYDKSVSAPLQSGELDRVKMTVELERFYYAPIVNGQTLGHLVFTLDGKVIATSNIYASNSVSATGIQIKNSSFFMRMFDNFTKLLRAMTF